MSPARPSFDDDVAVPFRDDLRGILVSWNVQEVARVGRTSSYCTSVSQTIAEHPRPRIRR
jgi:hypothetical protein